MSPLTCGDYQTRDRMAAKLKAVRLPLDLTGKRVLDLGCDHGWWSKLASDRGAARVLGVDRGRGVRGSGHVDLVALCRSRGWRRCEFLQANLGVEWPELGQWDLVFCFALYHHLYGQVGDHDTIWRWLRERVAPGGLLIWEGPLDARDGVVRRFISNHASHTGPLILGAARRYFEVEEVGPALYRSHRYVLHCRPRPPEEVGEHDPGSGQERLRAGEQGFSAPTDDGGPADVRVDALPGDAQPAGGGADGGAGEPARTHGADGARDADWTAPLVVGIDPYTHVVGAGEGGPGTGTEHEDGLPGAGGAGELSGAGPERRRLGELRTDRALVLGGGQDVWKEVRALEAMMGYPWDGYVVAANDIGIHAPVLHHWCTLHPEKMAGWERERRQAGRPAEYTRWGRRIHQSVDRQVTAWGGGSSGLLGVTVARDALGCERIVLCGVPMTRSPHFPESTVHPRGKPWPSAHSHWKVWVKDTNVARMKGRVRSMSGRTKDLLGAPTREWLEGEPERTGED